MEQNLINDDLIRQLCAVHDEALSKQRQTKESTPKLSNGTEENKGYTSESQTTWFASLGMFISHRRLIVLMLCFICDGKKSRNRRYNDPFTLSETEAGVLFGKSLAPNIKQGETFHEHSTCVFTVDDIVWLKKLLVCGSLQPSGKAPTSLLFDFTWTTSKMIVFQGAQPNIIGGCVPVNIRVPVTIINLPAISFFNTICAPVTSLEISVPVRIRLNFKFYYPVFHS